MKERYQMLKIEKERLKERNKQGKIGRD